MAVDEALAHLENETLPLALQRRQILVQQSVLGVVTVVIFAQGPKDVTV